MPKEQLNFIVEDAQIFYLNFAGKVNPFNKNGERSFAVEVDEKMAKILQRDGWNVKQTKVREEGDVPKLYVPVYLRYDRRPPHVVMITSTGKRNLTEDMVEILDGMDLRTVDVIVNGHQWEMNGNSGVRGYLKSMYVTIEEDALARKYADVPDTD